MELEGPGPELDDGEVRLRGWEIGDLECVRAASAEGRIPESTSVPVDFTEQAGTEYIERQRRRQHEGAGWARAITDSISGEAVGYVGLLLRSQPGVVGLGYWLIPEAREKGYATRAVRLLSAWALGTGGFPRVEAWVEPENLASARVLERCGYQYEGRLRSFLEFGTRRSDALVYSRTRDDEGAATSQPNAFAFDRFPRYVIHHVQLAMPPGEEDRARQFFGGVLGMAEVEKPPELATRGGVWFRAGRLELHLGVVEDFTPATKAHPGILTDDLESIRARLEAADWGTESDGSLPGFRRFCTVDCFGNRLEFLAPET